MFEAALFFHIALAAALFGAPLGMVRNLKTSLAAGPQAFKAAAADAATRGKIAGVSSVLVLLSGVGLIFIKGGFAEISKSYHVSLTLMLVLVAVGVVLLRPTVGKIGALAAAADLDAAAAGKLIKRLAMGTGIIHLLWAILLFLMVKPF
jgi:hypothetical protein